jgi:hypothetical protein
MAMKARRLLESSMFEPETLRVIYKAFDAAWAEIADHFTGDEIATEYARLRLAHAVLIVASGDSEAADRLKDDALQVMALAARKRD